MAPNTRERMNPLFLVYTQSKVEKFLHGGHRFSSRIKDENEISDVIRDTATDCKIRGKNADKRFEHNRRSDRDRRSGLDTRSEEDKFLQGERRSSVNRRSGVDRRYRSFKKARTYVRSLGLKSVSEWHDYHKSGMSHDDIPVAPHHVYANDGWAGWGDWLGANETYLSEYRSFKKARAFLGGLVLTVVFFVVI